MANSRDGGDELRARLAQMDPKVIVENHRFMQRLGPRGLGKVIALKGVPEETTFVGGYITTIAALLDKTPAEMERILGLRQNDLSSGAAVYQLDQVPGIGTFRPRGYTTLPDGRPLRSGFTVDEFGYWVGYGAWQATLVEAQPATLLAILGSNERFNPGLHPKYRIPHH